MPPHELTHASFFSGVGGLDLGLERAGWEPVSFSEIEPYAIACLSEHWPRVEQLGDILALRERERGTHDQPVPGASRWREATLWSGGFPCQDLSVAGKRAGLAGARSGLAYAFLDLVEWHRPAAVLLENVEGLLSSHAGRDLGVLLRRLADLGYWWAYRVLDAQFFGVPQRRRRVFIVALHAAAGVGAEGPAEVLSVGTRCGWHPATGPAPGEEPADRFADGVGAAGPLEQAVTSKWWRGASGPSGDEHHNIVIDAEGAQADPGGGRAPDGLAGWLDGGARVAGALRSSDGGADVDHVQAGHLVLAYRKAGRAQSSTDAETWTEDGLANTLNPWDSSGEVRSTHAIVELGGEQGGSARPRDATEALLPLGLDSHRYRAIGNGVVTPVAEWIGHRLRAVLEGGGEC